MKINGVKRRVFSGVMAVTLVFAMGVGVLADGESVATAKKATKIVLSKKSLSVKAGNEKTLRLKGVTTKKQFKKIKWTVSDKSVADIDADDIGKTLYVFGNKPGKVSVKAKYKKKTYTCKVTVRSSGSGKVYLPESSGGESTAVYWSYEDSWFTAPASTYNQKIATMTAILAWASVPEYEEFAKGNPSFYVKRVTDMLGFDGYRTNEDYKVKPTADSFGVAFAKKQIKSGDKTYTLIVIVPRSSGYGKEWASNMTLGTSGDHEGFSKSSKKLLSDLTQYMTDEQITGDVKLWFACHSRGASTANLAEAYIADHPEDIPKSVTIEKEDIYGYNLSCLHPTTFTDETEKKRKETDYPFIHNIEMPNDFFTHLMSESYGFTRYGVTHKIEVNDEITGKAVYVLLKSIDRQLYVRFDKSNPEKNDAKGLIAAFSEAMKKTIPDRQTFVSEYQEKARQALDTDGNQITQLGLILAPVINNVDYKSMTMLDFLGKIDTITLEHYLQVLYVFLTDFDFKG